MEVSRMLIKNIIDVDYKALPPKAIEMTKKLILEFGAAKNIFLKTMTANSEDLSL